MTVTELTQDVQFTVDQGRHVTAVVQDPAKWRRTPGVTALEDAEDRALVQALDKRLAKGPIAAEALRWQDVAGEWQ